MDRISLCLNWMRVVVFIICSGQLSQAFSVRSTAFLVSVGHLEILTPRLHVRLRPALGEKGGSMGVGVGGREGRGGSPGAVNLCHPLVSSSFIRFQFLLSQQVSAGTCFPLLCGRDVMGTDFSCVCLQSTLHTVGPSWDVASLQFLGRGGGFFHFCLFPFFF